MPSAIVVGGSVAGLCAARVLADHFAPVTVIDRDALPQGPAPRKGVPQARHVHALLARGNRELEALFPGFDAELARLGVPELELGHECGWLTPLGWIRPFEHPLPARFFSRDLLEAVIRARVRSISNVRFLDGTEASGLLVEGDRVVGVQAGGERRADLVVEAAGRGSQLPAWLERAGFPRPEDTGVDAKVVYATRRFSGLGPYLPAPWRAVVVLWDPPNTHRAGVIMPIEGGQHLVTLVGAMGEVPPTGLDAFLEYARSLRSPWVYEVIRHGQAEGEPHSSRSTENRLRLYHQLARFPRRLLVIGDALCASNPIRGQGMTAAALEARKLEQLLRRHRSIDLVSEEFRRQAGKLIGPLWALATAEDIGMVQRAGKSDWFSTAARRYIATVAEQSRTDSELSRLLIEVMQLLQPPGNLMSPAVVAKVAARAAARWVRRTPRVPPTVDPRDAGWQIPAHPPPG